MLFISRGHAAFDAFRPGVARIPAPEEPSNPPVGWLSVIAKSRRPLIHGMSREERNHARDGARTHVLAILQVASTRDAHRGAAAIECIAQGQPSGRRLRHLPRRPKINVGILLGSHRDSIPLTPSQKPQEG